MTIKSWNSVCNVELNRKMKQQCPLVMKAVVNWKIGWSRDQEVGILLSVFWNPQKDSIKGTVLQRPSLIISGSSSEEEKEAMRAHWYASPGLVPFIISMIYCSI